MPVMWSKIINQQFQLKIMKTNKRKKPFYVKIFINNKGFAFKSLEYSSKDKLLADFGDP